MRQIMQELLPFYCKQKSFYGKARIINTIDETNGTTLKVELYSYTTNVCTVEHNYFSKTTIKISIPSMYSRTTTKHIKEFIVQYYGGEVWENIKEGYNKGNTEFIVQYL